MTKKALNEQGMEEKESLEAAIEWLESQELTVNVGNVTGEGDKLIESSAGCALRLLRGLVPADTAESVETSDPAEVQAMLRTLREETNLTVTQDTILFNAIMRLGALQSRPSQSLDAEVLELGDWRVSLLDDGRFQVTSTASHNYTFSDSNGAGIIGLAPPALNQQDRQGKCACELHRYPAAPICKEGFLGCGTDRCQHHTHLGQCAHKEACHAPANQQAGQEKV